MVSTIHPTAARSVVCAFGVTDLAVSSSQRCAHALTVVRLVAPSPRSSSRSFFFSFALASASVFAETVRRSRLPSFLNPTS
jgi:hypothetical protein